ncbi:hypothetical protein [Noviherbaspirillum aerium]|uniref:hypothetical protein n=1 Tax=Noviherbaspirillum aerium TaxID=2588497 RepID=UPI00124F38B8|nr:hypothetical protein [Noviherbaspirillum aerium]
MMTNHAFNGAENPMFHGRVQPVADSWALKQPFSSIETVMHSSFLESSGIEWDTSQSLSG